MQRSWAAGLREVVRSRDQSAQAECSMQQRGRNLNIIYLFYVYGDAFFISRYICETNIDKNIGKCNFSNCSHLIDKSFSQKRKKREQFLHLLTAK